MDKPRYIDGGNYNAAASIQSNKGIIFNQSTRVFYAVNTTTGATTPMTLTNVASIPRSLNYNVATYDPATSRLFLINENLNYGHIFTVNVAGNSVTYVSEKDFGQGFHSDDCTFINGKVIGLDADWVEIWDVTTNTYTEIRPVGNTSVADINGDGKADFITTRDNGTATENSISVYLALNNGSYAVTPVTTIIPTGFATGVNGTETSFIDCGFIICNSGVNAPLLSAHTKTNTCLAVKANLGTITASNKPTGAIMTWHTASPAMASNKVVDSTQVNAGKYYAVFYDAVNGCYANNGNAVDSVTIAACSFCVAGSTAPILTAATKSNTCPAITVDLSTITATNKPSGTVLTWHTAATPTAANKVADSTAVTTVGTY